jgi:hypothetical protein
MDFHSLHALVKVGYEHGTSELATWRENGQLAKVLDV